MRVNSCVVLVELCPARFTIPARDGEETLVPPKTNQPLNPWHEVLSYTETPVLGSASNEKSGAERCVVSALAMPTCQLGIDSYLLGPPPLPLQPVSLLKVPLELSFTLVPPAETTKGETLGYP